jgi:multiple sugar transport system permease protein
MSDAAITGAAAGGGVTFGRARAWSRALTTLSLTGPAMALMALFLIGPLLCVLALSFTDYQLGAKSLRFIGLGNYVEMFRDPVFRTSLLNTLTYVAVVVPLSVGLGLGVAMLIQAGTGLRSFYRAVYFLPVMATLIAMSIVWEFMLHPSFGLVNAVFKLFGSGGYDWLQNRAIVLYTFAAIGIWQSVGFNMVLFLAGLTAIPSDLYEAAAVDGVSSGWDRFWTVTWPLLGPVTLFVVIITAIRSFQVFDTVQVLTQGGPNHASEVLLITMYQEGFQYFRTGYASAVTVVFLVFVVTLALIKTAVLDRRVHYS